MKHGTHIVYDAASEGMFESRESRKNNTQNGKTSQSEKTYHLNSVAVHGCARTSVSGPQCRLLVIFLVSNRPHLSLQYFISSGLPYLVFYYSEALEGF